MSEIAITFVIPASSAFQSGGNIYNEQLIKALSLQKVNINALPPEQWKEADKELPTIVIYDSIYLSDLFQWGPILEGPKQGLLVHHLPGMFERTTPAARANEQAQLQIFDFFLVTSDFTRDYLIQLGIAIDSICVIPPAFGVQPNPSYLPGSDLRVIWVANLIKRKGILPFLQAFQRRGYPAVKRITLLGEKDIDPVYAMKCLQLIRNDSELARRIQYRGVLSHEGVQAQYQNANLFLSTSYMETYGMALQEARAAGLPILALQGGNVAMHVKDGVNGFLAKTMEELVQRLVSISQHRSLFTRVQRNARSGNVQSMYTWAQAAENVMAYIRSNLSKR